ACTRSRSATTGGPTPRARRSRGATASSPSARSSGFAWVVRDERDRRGADGLRGPAQPRLELQAGALARAGHQGFGERAALARAIPADQVTSLQKNSWELAGIAPATRTASARASPRNETPFDASCISSSWRVADGPVTDGCTSGPDFAPNASMSQ